MKIASVKRFDRFAEVYSNDAITASRCERSLDRGIAAVVNRCDLSGKAVRSIWT